MSLKAIHIFFIALSILLALGFGVWSIYHQYTLMGVISFVIGIALVFYGVRFLRKLRHVDMR